MMWMMVATASPRPPPTLRSRQSGPPPQCPDGHTNVVLPKLNERRRKSNNGEILNMGEQVGNMLDGINASFF